MFFLEYKPKTMVYIPGNKTAILNKMVGKPNQKRSTPVLSAYALPHPL